MAEPVNLNQLFFGAMDRAANRPVVMRRKQGARWEDISGAELLNRVNDLSLGLRELGLRAKDRVAILSENRPEWAIGDYAFPALGPADLATYPAAPAST